ncbi:hypothetical protein Lal_00015273 [Lupinus albus]|nr:hypothetical protein Lal_00015273 [Lupinus albus]
MTVYMTVRHFEPSLFLLLSRNRGGPSSATPSRPTKKRNPYFTPELQASRLVRFHGRILAYVRYADVPWLVEEGFQFPHELEVQGTNIFIGLHGKLHPPLIREFYSNFVYKNGRYITMVKGKLIVLDEELFLDVGGLSSSGEPLGNCEKEQWNDFESLATYISCLRDTVTRNTNHAQPTTNDLKMIFAIKQGILVNWPANILKVMSGIETSSSRLHAYGIFISRIIDHMEIDTSDVEIKLTNTHDHQLREYLIHKMGIYKTTGIWMYQEDYRTIVDLDLSDEETPVEQQEQPTAPSEAPKASHAPPFGLAHLDALEQCLNPRVDAGLQALNSNVDSGLMNLYDRLAVDFQRENDHTRERLTGLLSYCRLCLLAQTLHLPTNIVRTCSRTVD